jgi:acetyl-CoA/propionyl-CoA carboxylase biotin carboxyl carrier protein
MPTSQHVEQKTSFETLPEHLLAPINGAIVAWKVQTGEHVTEGQVVAIMEAMKMEVQVLAHQSGQIQISANVGTTCQADHVIASIQ